MVIDMRAPMTFRMACGTRTAGRILYSTTNEHNMAANNGRQHITNRAAATALVPVFAWVRDAAGNGYPSSAP